jgi:CheY-like chemotaxis protein
VTDLLGPLGFDVRVAADGATCLLLAAEEAPDLFLLDIAMPGMTGWALARRLREAEQRAPVIMVSANALELAPPAEGQHHDDVLAKPLSVAALLDKIGTLLGIEWTFAEPAAPAAAVARLTPAQAAGLRQLAAIGYVGGIRERLDALEAEAPDTAPAIAELRAHVSAFRLDAFVATLPEDEP